jgi:glycosyltransferase involved in cell wall biosynthesis
MLPEVLFVSKPAVEPFNDGSKCLVRDIAGALTSYVPRVMVTQDADAWVASVLAARVYARKGGYSPALVDNARVFVWLLLRSREQLWHFFFAPNRRTSQMGRLLKQIRRVPVVQTVASPPRAFREPQRLLFGDVVVTHSQWTKNEFIRAYAEAGIREVPRLEVIAPTVPDLVTPSNERQLAMRSLLTIPEAAPLLLYPGDLDVGGASQVVTELVGPMLREIPEAHFVFAYRKKTPRAAEAAQNLESRLQGTNVRFVAEVPDMHALVAVSDLVLFPVDDLYGKVDLPIVVLEAMQLGVPVVTLDRGPLADLRGVWHVPPGNIECLVQIALTALRDRSARQFCVDAQRQAVACWHRPAQAAKSYEAIYDGLLSQRS